MCLYILDCHLVDGRYRAAKADQHYSVLKVLDRRWDDEWVTPYRHARVTFGQMMNVNGLHPHRLFGRVDVGLHSCRNSRGTYTHIGGHRAKVFPAVIPKGAQLFYGHNNDVVSDKLIIFETEEAMIDWLTENQ